MTEQKTNQIRVRVLFFGGAKDTVGTNSLGLSLDSPATLATASATLLDKFPELKRFGRSLLFAVNQEYSTPDTEIADNDELAVFPPVSGGSGTVCD